MTGLVDYIGGLLLTQIQDLVDTRLAAGWLFAGVNDRFLFWTRST